MKNVFIVTMAMIVFDATWISAVAKPLSGGGGGAGIPITESAAHDPQNGIQTFTTPYDDGALETQFLALIHSAKHKIRMIAYGFTDPDVTDALVDAQKRGVDIGIVMDSTEAAGAHQKPLVDKLKAAGIPVWIGKSVNHDQLIHCKATIFDDEIVESGSWNYSPSASQQDNFADIIKSDKRAAMFYGFYQSIKKGITDRQDKRK